MGHVHPNPLVGCILVREDTAVGEGWHQRYGGAHAEVEALQAAGPAALGATAYVSLEPCRHFGKTPPCTEALRAAGVRRVVYGAADPGADSGGGGDALRSAGLDVVGPVWTQARARAENPAFFHLDSSRPWVVLKLAVSAEGWIARAPGVRSTITGEEGQAEVHRLRSQVDGILVGGETFRVDHPRLTVRKPASARVQPIRIVVTARGAVPPDGAIWREPGPPVWVASPQRPSELPALEGVEWISVPFDEGTPERQLALPSLFGELRARGIRALLVEGGARMASSLLKANLVDRVVLVRSEAALGGKSGVPAFLDPAWQKGAKDPEGALRDGTGPAGWRLAAPPRPLGTDTWWVFDSEADEFQKGLNVHGDR